MFNFSYRRVGGLTFIKLGRLTLSFCVAADPAPIGSKPWAAKAKRERAARRDQKIFERGLKVGERWARNDLARYVKQHDMRN